LEIEIIGNPEEGSWAARYVKSSLNPDANGFGNISCTDGGGTIVSDRDLLEKIMMLRNVIVCIQNSLEFCTDLTTDKVTRIGFNKSETSSFLSGGEASGSEGRDDSEETHDDDGLKISTANSQ
jgi:hypothetical protein